MGRDPDKNTDNQASPKTGPERSWTKKEMEEAEPLPMPELDDDEGERGAGG